MRLCQRCSAREDWSGSLELKGGVCHDCREELAEWTRELALRDEYARRLRAWEAQEGTRRRVAASLAREAEKYLSIQTAQRVAAWAFTWEMTGADVDLQKVLRRLMPEWKRDKKSVLDPTEAAQKAQRDERSASKEKA